MITTSGGSSTVLEVLKSKHTPSSPPTVEALYSGELRKGEPLPVIFERINVSLIHSIVLKMDGAAGPSGLDATTGSDCAPRSRILPMICVRL